MRVLGYSIALAKSLAGQRPMENHSHVMNTARPLGKFEARWPEIRLECSLMSVHKVPPLDSRSRAKRFQRTNRQKKSYINRYVKNESCAVCFSRWAQGIRQNHTVGSRYESTEGRQQ